MSSIQERLQLKRVPLDKWSTREKLCLASAVASNGDCSNWMSVSRTLKLICGSTRPADWFFQKSCAAQYGKLLENVETPKRKKRTASERDSLTPVETPGECIMRKLSEERVNELKNLIQEQKQQFMKIKDEIAVVQNADDAQLREIWAQIELEKKQREKDQAQHVQWLKEREEKKIEIERQWRPNLVYQQQNSPSHSPPQNKPGGLRIKIKSEEVESDDSSSKPGTSPLLTSLLKSAPTTTIATSSPSLIASTSTAVSSIRTSAPTITNLLTGCSAIAETSIIAQPLPKPAPSIQLPKDILKMTTVDPPKTPISQTTPTLSKLLDNSKPKEILMQTEIKTEPQQVQQQIDPIKMETDLIDDSTIAKIIGTDGSDDNNENLNKDEDQQLIDVLNGLFNDEGLENILTDENNPIILCPDIFKEDEILEKVDSFINEVEEENAAIAEEIPEAVPTTNEIKEEYVETIKNEIDDMDLLDDVITAESNTEVNVMKPEAPAVQEVLPAEPIPEPVQPAEIHEQEIPAETEEDSVKEEIAEESNEITNLISNSENVVPVEPEIVEEQEIEVPNETQPASVEIAEEEVEDEEEDEEDHNESPKLSPAVTLEESDDSGEQSVDNKLPANPEATKTEDPDTIIVLDESPEEESNDEDGKKESDNVSKSGDDDDDDEEDDDEDDEKNNLTDLEPIDLDIDETITKPVIEKPVPIPQPEPEVVVEKEVEDVIESDSEVNELKEEESDTVPETAEQPPERKNSTDDEMFEDAKDDMEDQQKAENSPAAASPKIKDAAKPNSSSAPAESEQMVTVILDTDDDLPMEVIKEDKAGKMKRDYSRRKPDELSISKSEESSSPSSSSGTPPISNAMKLEELENKPALSLRLKLKERERSESPFVTEDEANDNIPRTRRRYSSTPVIDSIPNSPASSDDREYRAWKKSIMTVYNRLCTYKYASIFLRPIGEDQSPGYKSVVLRTMDLQTIKKNIENGQIRTTAEFQRDVMLMCYNAIIFNKKENNTYIMAREMMTESIGIIDSIMETAKSRDTAEKTSTTPTLSSASTQSATKRSGRKVGNIKYM